MNDILEEFELAKKAREYAYDPYTNFKVGAVLTCKNGKKYMGCNISNFGIQSNCAERVAFLKAISENDKEFDHIVIVGGKDNLVEVLPCGYCRQFMSEFVEEYFKIYTLDGEKIKEYSIKELLPYKFKI